MPINFEERVDLKSAMKDYLAQLIEQPDHRHDLTERKMLPDPHWLVGKRVRIWWDGNQAYLEANVDSYDEDMKLTFHSARLLPQYCFPLGLDTVDKLSKVPSWLRNSMRGNYINNLLRKTLESNASKQQINMVLKSFVSGRNWWVRPK